MEKLFQSCGIKYDTKSIKIGKKLIEINHAVDMLDLINIPKDDLRYLFIYKKLKGENKIEDFYRIMYPIDIDCIPDTLGFPIKVKDAKKWFTNTSIDFNKIPKIQKDLIDVKKNTFMDPITLDVQSLDNVIQLKESGELMGLETFHELVKMNTTKWCGEENVGFFSPITKTMIGNPVLYNFDRIDFFSQPSSTLQIRRIKNHSKTPSSNKPLIIPDYYFEFRYINNLVFYLPDTPDGRKIFFLFKDAFKKGNLFAVDKNGYIRHGRVHKKTGIGYGTHSFPDDTYIERVYGELNNLGSTLFTYLHSMDKVFDLESDPYPGEKRFQIKYS